MTELTTADKETETLTKMATMVAATATTTESTTVVMETEMLTTMTTTTTEAATMEATMTESTTADKETETLTSMATTAAATMTMTEAMTTELTMANKNYNNGDVALAPIIEEALISIDQPESAATEAEEACKQLLLDAAVHVQIARAQRALYQAHVAAAVCNATDGKEHSVQRYVFVVDSGQNMQVPIFNNDQPGSTYYFSPLGMYNLGMVDHAHVYNDGRISELIIAMFTTRRLARRVPTMWRR